MKPFLERSRFLIDLSSIRIVFQNIYFLIYLVVINNAGRLYNVLVYSNARLATYNCGLSNLSTV